MNILEEKSFFFGDLIGPHLSLEDLWRLRSVSLYFRDQVDHYLRRRFSGKDWIDQVLIYSICKLDDFIRLTDTYNLKNPFSHFIRQIDSNGKIDEARVTSSLFTKNNFFFDYYRLAKSEKVKNWSKFSKLKLPKLTLSDSLQVWIRWTQLFYAK